MINDGLTFIRELPRSYSEIGAMFPSSRYSGKVMVGPIKQAKHPISILEVGPGTGPFTRQILQLMRPKDHLVICELNQRFLDRLKRTLKVRRDFERNRERIKGVDQIVRRWCDPVSENGAVHKKSRYSISLRPYQFNWKCR